MVHASSVQANCHLWDNSSALRTHQTPASSHRTGMHSSWLLATGYWLLATGYWLLATGYWLLATGHWLQQLADLDMAVRKAKAARRACG